MWNLSFAKINYNCSLEIYTFAMIHFRALNMQCVFRNCNILMVILEVLQLGLNERVISVILACNQRHNAR